MVEEVNERLDPAGFHSMGISFPCLEIRRPLLIADGREVVPESAKAYGPMLYLPGIFFNANNLALGMKDKAVSGVEGAVIKGPVEVGRGSIGSGSYLVGPVCIGEDCDIGPSATILPSTSIGDYARIRSHL